MLFDSTDSTGCAIGFRQLGLSKRREHFLGKGLDVFCQRWFPISQTDPLLTSDVWTTKGETFSAHLMIGGGLSRACREKTLMSTWLVDWLVTWGKKPLQDLTAKKAKLRYAIKSYCHCLWPFKITLKLLTQLETQYKCLGHRPLGLSHTKQDNWPAGGAPPLKLPWKKTCTCCTIRKQGKATLFIEHFSYTRQTQSASHRNIGIQ